VGKKTSTSTSQVSIPPEVLERYNAVNKRAEEVAANPFQKYGTTAEDFVAQINQQQQSGIANVNAAAGSAQPYIDAATVATTAGMSSAQPGELDINKYMNPFQQQVIDATMKQMGQANEQAQSGALGTAASSGAFGGDRAGIAAANLANQQGLAMGSTLAGLNAQNYGQAVQTAQQQQGVTLGATQADLARYLQGGGQLANLGVTAQTAGLQGAEAQINAGTLQQQTEQAGKTALVNQFMQEQGYPFQVAQFLANIAMGTGSLSGSTTTTTQPTSFFSDRRLKEDVKRIGKTDDGLPIYSFKYKGDDAEQTHVGFMADEVEKVKPEAVGLHPSGYKTVDYAKATENSMGGGVMPSRAGQGFAEGGVAGPYGSSAGSQVDFGGYVPQAYLPVGGLMTADPALMDNSNRNLAALMESSANFGTNLQKLEEQFGKDGTFWDMFDKQDEYASGGAAYLRSHPGGGLVPNSAKSYLSDTIESQGDDDRPELKTAEGGGKSGKSPAENIADLGKMAMTIFGFQNGGRIGYADGGTETEEQRLRRLLRGDVPEAQTLGSLPDAVVQPAQSARNSVLLPNPANPQFPDGGLVPAIPTPPVVRPSVVLPNPPDQQFPDGGLVPAIPSPPKDRLATSPRPPARPTGLVPAAAETEAVTPQPASTTPAPTMSDLSAAGIGGANISAAPEQPTGVAKAAIPAAEPLTDTGVAPEGGYEAIVPLNTQLDFVMHELQQPAYDDYLKRGYRTPSEAAVAFDTIYERSGGAGNKIAAANAEDIYAAAKSGDMSGLPPNVVTAYTHFVQNGMDPIQAAGAAGRLMVESYAHLDPNARNTLGGGNGTYGIAQWRGDRMENLANFAGVPFDALTNAPVSTPEGRYYSSTSGGLGGDRTLRGGAGGDGGLGRAALTSDKPYGERNALGKMFYNENGTVNKDALLSILSGIGTMASSPSLYLGSAILQGVGGAANTYMAREQQRADITKQNISNMSELVKLYNDFSFSNPEYADMSIDDFARSQGLERLLPKGGIDYNTSTGFDVTQGDGQRVSMNEARGYIDAGDGIKIPFMNDYASLNRVFNEYSAAPEGSRMRALADQAKAKMTEIEATGYTTGIAADGSAVTIPVDAVRAKRGSMATDAANVDTTQIFRDEAQRRLPEIGGDVDRVDRQIEIYTKVPSGAWTEEKARLGAIAATLGLEGIAGLPEGEQIANIEEAIKEKALGIVNRGGTAGMTDYERQFISQSTATPNLQPEAIKKLLAIEKATLLREQAMLEGHREWMTTASNPYDLNAYKAEFSAANPISKYIKDVEAGMPKFAGEEGAAPQVGEIKRFTGTDGKTYTGKWDGKGWVKQ
jgi:hypothetical protein